MDDARRYGSKKSYPYILNNDKAINIDEQDDLFLASYKLKRLRK